MSAAWEGVCNTSGTSVTWTGGGASFTQGGFNLPAGYTININGTNYTIQTFNSSSSLTLTRQCSHQSGVVFYIPYNITDVLQVPPQGYVQTTWPSVSGLLPVQTGTPTAGNLASWNASGVLQDAGQPHRSAWASWTPNVSSSSGTITTLGTVTLRTTCKLDNSCILPSASTSRQMALDRELCNSVFQSHRQTPGNRWFGSGREDSVSGQALICLIFPNSTTAQNIWYEQYLEAHPVHIPE